MQTKSIKVADVAWIATALLHKENPDRTDFSLSEIMNRAKSEFRNDNRPGVWQHIVSHCIASNPPDPAKLRMLQQTGTGRRRLYRPGDSTHPERTGKTHPHKDDLPPEYQPLLDWYTEEYCKIGTAGANGGGNAASGSPEVLLQFVGLISAYDLAKMKEAIRQGCERVDSNEW